MTIVDHCALQGKIARSSAMCTKSMLLFMSNASHSSIMSSSSCQVVVRLQVTKNDSWKLFQAAHCGNTCILLDVCSDIRISAPPSFLEYGTASTMQLVSKAIGFSWILYISPWTCSHTDTMEKHRLFTSKWLHTSPTTHCPSTQAMITSLREHW